MRKLLLISLIFLAFTIQAFSKDRFCFVQLASFKSLKVAEKLFEDVKTNEPVYILKFKEIYGVRVGPFENFKICKLQREKLKNDLRKYRIEPIMILSSHSIPPSNYIIKEKTSKTKSYKEEKRRVEPKRIGKISREKEKKDASSLVYLYIEKAKVCMGKKDCTNAVRYLKLAIAKGGENPKLYTYLGYAYTHLGRYTKALNAFKKALKIDPNYAEAYAGIGFLYLKLNSPKAAVIAFRRAHNLNPKEISYSVNLAISLLGSGNIDEAILEFQKLKNKYPFLPEIYYNEAVAYLKKGYFKKAIGDFEIFLELTKANKFYEDYRKEVLKVLNQIKLILKSKNEH
ncbi:tetratricopeptide repeat protein [Desulfurobacterium thermolithotrophum]|uniref:tetratricopeptide repeat protein n=1 Tax=Desulfurobacterium thermolithotrophum TaxID=64160 RepID=UPI0013D54173|nr:tetratricopeptide repeat protein [Desulfurobacterium thermolithotrophum]